MNLNSDKILGFLVFLQGLISFYPPVKNLENYNQIWAFSLFCIVLLLFLRYSSSLLRFSFHRYMIFLFVLYTVFVAYLGGNGVIGNRFLELSQIFVFYILYEIIKFKRLHNISIKVFHYLLPFVLLTCYETIIALVANPFAARAIKGDPNIDVLIGNGVGGYGFIYLLVFLSNILLYVILDKHVSKKYRLIYTICFFVFLVTIIFSNFTTALLLVSIGFVVKILLPKINTVQMYLFIFVGIAVNYFSAFFIDTAINIAANFLGDSLNLNRLLEIRQLINEGTGGGAIQARAASYDESLTIFFNNPVFGIITDPIERIGDGVAGFGQHSQILDTFALYGFLIGIMQLYILFNPLIKRLQKKTRQLTSLPFLMIITTAILFTGNNATPSIGFALFFVYPTVLDYLLEKKSNKKIKFYLSKSNAHK